MSTGDVLVDPGSAAQYRKQGWWRDETVVDDLRAAVDLHPGKIAIVDARSDGHDEVMTYAVLNTEVRRIASVLLRLGVQPGDVVSLQLPNCWQFTALHLACATVGAITNPIVPILRRREVSFILQETRSRVCFVRDSFRGFDYAAMLLSVRAQVDTLDQIVVLGDAPAGTYSFENLLAEVEAPPDELILDSRRPLADSAAQIQFTSGTTGVPKGVVHTYNTLYLSERVGPDFLGVVEEDVMLMASPLAHNTGFMYGMSMPLLLGMTSVYQEVWDPERALGLIEKYGVTLTMGSTTFLTDLCAAAIKAGTVPASLRLFICGGATIPPFAAELVQTNLDAQLVACWGMTENGIATTTRPSDPIDVVTSTDGGPVSWVEVRVVDEQGNDLGMGQEGRLFVKAANEHVAYLGRPDLYDAAMVDGWFDTGDLARITPSGYIRITGRTKDVIIRGGENIPALEIELGLLEHPEVQDVAVVASPHSRFGECACAIVVAKDSQRPPSLSDLLEHLDALGMAKSFWPERLELREELPRTASGKVQKYVLREELRESTATQPPTSTTGSSSK